MHEIWLLSHTTEYHPRGRSRIQLMSGPVVRPLPQFKNTEELVPAIRDAIKGHPLALGFDDGVLHRGVSFLEDILVVDHPHGYHSSGILHDFDDSPMTRALELPSTATSPLTLVSSRTPRINTWLEPANHVVNGSGLKERTGPHYFTAIELLSGGLSHGTFTMEVQHEARHDLESFYWVLLWIVLRHAHHTEANGQEAYLRPFSPVDDGLATYYTKSGWLNNRIAEPITIADNAPLTELLSSFHYLVFLANFPVTPATQCIRRPLTYDAVLQVFDKALARNDWPVDDKAIPFRLPEGRTRMVFGSKVKLDRKHKKRRVEDEYEEESGSEASDLVSASTTLYSSASAMARRSKKSRTAAANGTRSHGAAAESSRVASHTSRRTRRGSRKTTGGGSKGSGRKAPATG
ncbi:hypothetical protein OH77DRAFT_1431014 [Trametes cingulata]|nr:hypothetical protein OH77DRAFT_1431014 [Trametes cingulata]